MTKEFLEKYESSTCPFCRSTDTLNVCTYGCTRKVHCYRCRNDYIIEIDKNRNIANVTNDKSEPIEYSWKDLVEYNSKLYAFHFPISGITDNDSDNYQIDDFIEKAAEELNCNTEDIKLWTMGEIDRDTPYDMASLPFGAESCGAYINDIPVEYYVD